ncbi:MAG: N-acetylmuramoyl-L-alanine amidase [Pseudomonadota bacterium]|nr:N-acetylmuramoyl-L-alanine amidase [Pseudomonadota bacterium]
MTIAQALPAPGTTTARRQRVARQKGHTEVITALAPATPSPGWRLSVAGTPPPPDEGDAAARLGWPERGGAGMDLLRHMAREPQAFMAQAPAPMQAGHAAPPSALGLDAQGVVHHPRVQLLRADGGSSVFPQIERGPLQGVNGVIVHQTDSPSAASTFNSYARAGANGAHFLIDKDGTIYQTASLTQQTWHVGKLKSRCMAESRCSPAETALNQRFAPTAEHQRERVKAPGDRYPSNLDALGIELVGQAFPRGDNNARYEAVTDAQNDALRWLVGELKAEFGLADSEVLRHPVVSRKNETEASTAQW